MSVYLVRLITDPARPDMAEELVGIINADSLAQLAYIVDEATNTKDCEYTKLPVGGILWERSLENISGGKVPLPRRDPETGEGPELPWAESALSENWCEVFYQRKKLHWHRFTEEHIDQMLCADNI